MRITSILAAGAVAALLMTPAAALAGDAKPSQAKAYGKLCQDQSKKHVKGQKGTPFSQCVVAMAHLQSGQGADAEGRLQEARQEARQGQEGHAVQPLREGRAQARERASLTQRLRRRRLRGPVRRRLLPLSARGARLSS